MRVCFYTLGCKVNLNETGALEQMFRANGFTIAQENEPADVFVVNSCTVTNFGDQKSRKWLRRKKRENPGAVTVLTGCYPQAFPEEAAQFTEADLVCGNGDRKAILDNVLKLLDGHERIVAITPHQRGEKFEELPVERFETHTRAFIKVEDCLLCGGNSVSDYGHSYVEGAVFLHGKGLKGNRISAADQCELQPVSDTGNAGGSVWHF